MTPKQMKAKIEELERKIMGLEGRQQTVIQYHYHYSQPAHNYWQPVYPLNPMVTSGSGTVGSVSGTQDSAIRAWYGSAQ